MRYSFTANQRLLFGFIYLALLVFTLLDTRYHFASLRTPIEFLLQPWQLLELRLRSVTTAPLTFVQTVLSSEKMILDLQRKNAQLQVQIAESESAKKENELLRAQVEKNTDTRETLFKKMVTAHVVSTGPLSYLDAGLGRGVVVGGFVFSEGILLGRVQNSERFFSNVATFSQGSWRTVVQTQNGVKGVVMGKNNQVLFTQVSADEKFEVGDRLFTIGSVSDGVPPELYIGQVKAKLEEVGAPVQTALVDQEVSIESSSIVLVKMRE